jgi:CRISPR-associated exonuclease Cas4
MYAEEDLIQISSLQHALFCERQFALIHLEQLWEENRFTAEGRLLHERVDVEHHELRRLFRQEFGMAVRSLEYGLVGKCDLVEIYLSPDGRAAEIVPVEFKRGTEKVEDVDRVQLCAQALCLEEMFKVPVSRGQFYYFKDHRRSTTEIDGNLRAKTLTLIKRVRRLLEEGVTPPGIYEKRKCDRCSLFDLCMPKSAGSGSKRVDPYIKGQIRSIQAEGKP